MHKASPKPVELSLHTHILYQFLMRDYCVMTRQPWDSISIPPRYIPDAKLRWFPSLSFLGVLFTTEEVCHFAGRLNMSVRGDGD